MWVKKGVAFATPFLFAFLNSIELGVLSLSGE